MNWIPVTNSMPPKPGVTVLAFANFITIATWHGGEEWSNGGFVLHAVTHWMPLPNPPDRERRPA